MFSSDKSPTNAVPNPTAWQSPPSTTRLSGNRQRIQSTSLLQGNRELLIAHAGEEYRLRLTRNDKLILTK